MTTFVLIAFFGYKTGGFSAEFNTKAACEVAAAQLKDLPISDDQRVFCTPKG